MILLLIILGGLLLLGGVSGFVTYRIKIQKKKKQYMDYLKKMGYDKIGYA